MKTITVRGHLNKPGEESRPFFKNGKIINETIDKSAFPKAINRADKIDALIDHDRAKVIASTADETLSIKEDSIGPLVELNTSNDEVIKAAEKNGLKGWSFNMRNPVDEYEERAGKNPLRTIKDFMLNEITLSINTYPYYDTGLVEVRSETETIEIRSNNDVSFKITDNDINYKFKNKLKRMELK